MLVVHSNARVRVRGGGERRGREEGDEKRLREREGEREGGKW